MSKFRESFGGILMCLCEILVGILLLISPLGFTSAIIIGGGWLLIALGAASAISYFRTPAAEAAKQQTLAKALALILVGAFLAFNSEWVIATLPALTLLYAVAILFTALIRIQWTVDALRLKRTDWYWTAIGALLAVVFAAIIMKNPFGTAAVMWSFVAISLIVEAILDLIAIIFTGKRLSRS